MGSTFYSKRLIRKEKRGIHQKRMPRIRPKTFETRELAKAHAERKGLKDYTILPKGKKFVIS